MLSHEGLFCDVVYIARSQKSELRLSGYPSGQGAYYAARTCDRQVLADLRESGGSSGRAVGYHHPRGPGFDSQSGPSPSQIFIAPLCPPGTK
ncbi:hypothetical protein PoB_005647400 [Plakobranchus ocellatus]|uniref:Uncharacterized protein n=1 Tax=Plakobranchus ocellatus TaxID=259542 RepID=A0AAV4CGQ5_9GAST|nr:hypothetical protein PoB_005647400 [Plakobranchus ocellatus]